MIDTYKPGEAGGGAGHWAHVCCRAGGVTRAQPFFRLRISVPQPPAYYAAGVGANARSTNSGSFAIACK